jgi:hypothetical protein
MIGEHKEMEAEGAGACGDATAEGAREAAVAASIRALRESDERDLAEDWAEFEDALCEYRAAKAAVDAAMAQREAAHGQRRVSCAYETWAASMKEFKRAEQRVNELHAQRAFSHAILCVTKAVELRLQHRDSEDVRRKVRMLLMPLKTSILKGGGAWVARAPDPPGCRRTPDGYAILRPLD